MKNNKKNQSVFIVVFFVSIYVLCIGIVFFLFTQIPAIYTQVQQQQFNEVKHDLQYAINAPSAEQPTLFQAIEDEGIVEFVVYEPNAGSVLYSTVPVTDMQVLPDLLNDKVVSNEGFYDLHTNDGTYVIWIAQYYISPQAVINIWMILLIVSIAVLLFIILASTTIVAFRLIRPMQRARENVYKLSKYQLDQINNGQTIGKYDGLLQDIQRFSQDLDKRIDSTEITYTALEQELQMKNEVMAYREMVLASLAHELKTPLLIAQYYLNELPRTDASEPIDIVSNKVDFALDKVNNLVHVAYQDDLSRLQEVKQFDLTALFADVYDEFREAFIEKNYYCELEVDDELLIEANSFDFKLIIHNALSNIYNYAKPEAYVKLSCFSELGKIYVLFYNDAQALSEEEQLNAFNLFYSIEKTGKESGTGLYAIRRFVSACGGTVTLHNKDQGVELAICFDSLALHENSGGK